MPCSRSFLPKPSWISRRFRWLLADSADDRPALGLLCDAIGLSKRRASLAYSGQFRAVSWLFGDDKNHSVALIHVPSTRAMGRGTWSGNAVYPAGQADS